MQLTEATTLDRKSGEAEGSAVPRTSPGNAEYYTQTKLFSRPPFDKLSSSAGLSLGNGVSRTADLLMAGFMYRLKPVPTPHTVSIEFFAVARQVTQ